MSDILSQSGLGRFGPPVKTENGKDTGKQLKPTNDWRVEGWPEKEEGETSTVSQTEEEFRQHLPSSWHITRFDLWGPKKVNHRGVAYNIRVEHSDGTELRLRPESTWPDSHHSESMKVYNSHKLKKVSQKGNTDKLLDASTLVRLSIPASILKTIIVAAREHNPQPEITSY